jgi:hypothetical protein
MNGARPSTGISAGNEVAVDDPQDSREDASVSRFSGEADPSFLLLLRQALGGHQDDSKELDVEASAPVERIGRFEVIEVLGRGGYGTVLRVRDLKLGCERAMKLPNPETLASPRSLARFMDEARKAVMIDHPNVVRVLEADEVFSLYYMVMEYCPGGSLSGWLARRPIDPPIPPRWAAALVAEIADGVQQAHAAGLLHRDLKPGNVMLVRVDDRNEADPPRFHPKVGDFGLAKALFDSPNRVDRTVSGTMIGTLAYMSPEQARGDKAIGEASDIYGLGAILYEVLTRSTPYPGSSEAEVLARILDDAPPPSPRAVRADLPRDLGNICRTALAKRPGDRYATAADLADDLRRFLRNDPVKGSPWWKRARAGLRQHRVRAAMAGLVLVSIIGGVTAWFHFRELKRRGEVDVLLNNLESATVGRFPALIPKLDPTDAQVADRLNGLFSRGTANQKLGAAITLARVRREYAGYCYDQLLKASPDEIGPISTLLRDRMTDLPARLAKELETSPGSSGRSEEKRDRQLANAACSLVILGENERGWPLLRFSPTPQARSFLIHLLGPSGVSPQVLHNKLIDKNTDPSIGRALIQALGQMPESAWNPVEWSRVTAMLLELYRNHPDAGLHASAKWLLRKWNRNAELANIDQELARAQKAREGFRWRVSRSGLTFVTIEDSEAGRVIEVSDTEIPRDLFLRFIPSHVFNMDASPDPDCPITSIDYITAALFCNAQSELDGIEKDHLCYGKPSKFAIDPVVGAIDLAGYRLLDDPRDITETRLACYGTTPGINNRRECAHTTSGY